MYVCITSYYVMFYVTLRYVTYLDMPSMKTSSVSVLVLVLVFAAVAVASFSV